MKRRFITFEAGMTAEAAGRRWRGEEESMKGLKGGNKFAVLKKTKACSLSATVHAFFLPTAFTIKIKECLCKRTTNKTSPACMKCDFRIMHNKKTVKFHTNHPPLIYLIAFWLVPCCSYRDRETESSRMLLTNNLTKSRGLFI